MVCTKCQVEKPLELFVPGKRYLKGYRKICRACWNSRNKHYRTPARCKTYNQRAYQKLRNNSLQWQRQLALGRKRYALLGHKRIRSCCVACGQWWLGTVKQRLFCSLSCMAKGQNNPRWLGGRRILHNGYVVVFAPTHPLATRHFVLEHRLVMEQTLGRLLTTNEHVHHLNGVKQDNRLENLVVLSPSEHSKLHWRIRKSPRL